MAINEGIFSIRLVIADFYMEKPVPGLDPVYSEFRGKEIKKVPIIRVFGSNAQGQKTCMHVHGIFPYFYVPYDQKDFESANKAIYQMAINLDKAINISLSQGSSSAQHVFKVQLVKGIPFYGYHRSDHQYLKIYMFNPRFVRRAANLLQSGAIMNKNFHPHEAHVPYVLQFMIDFNLYGMSFIHVPVEIIKFRRSDGSSEIPFKHVQESQILDCNVAKKLSCSTLEIDIGSSFILNRFQLVTKTNTTHTNPGIESIWHDEKLRRQKLAQSVQDDEEKLNAIPPLEVPSTQERLNVYPTESEIFYRTALVSKLVALETSLVENSQISDQTINCTFQSNTTNVTLNNSVATMNRQKKRTFNLSKMLQNSVYPEECTQNENLVNASVVENHLSNNNVFQQSLRTDMSFAVNSSSEEVKTPIEVESVFMDDTIVDEELVLSLTQTQQQVHVPLDATLRDEDLELLDVLQQLEQDNNEDKIDLDSSLAPLSQDHKNYALSPTLLDKETAESALQQQSSDTENIDEDDNIHDFSIALENLDDLILKLTQSQINPHDVTQEATNNLPQTDGSDDLQKTPTKATSTAGKTSPRTPTTPKQRRSTLASPSRSPRTPKSGYKYKPLPLVITNRSTGKKTISGPCNDTITPSKHVVAEKGNNIPTVSLRKKLALTELRRKSISIENDVRDEDNNLFQSTNVAPRRSSRSKDLDKTHVTCNLTPRRTNEKLLKVYNVDNQNDYNLVAEYPKKKFTSKKMSNGFSKQTITSEETIHIKSISAQDSNTVAVNDIIVKLNEASKPENSIPNIPLKDEDDDEIVDSDNESSIQLRKTPNLKRLRRSFLSMRSAKRRKVATNNADLINSSKFDTSATLVKNSAARNANSKSEVTNADLEKASDHLQMPEKKLNSPDRKATTEINTTAHVLDTDKLLDSAIQNNTMDFSEQAENNIKDQGDMRKVFRKSKLLETKKGEPLAKDANERKSKRIESNTEVVSDSSNSNQNLYITKSTNAASTSKTCKILQDNNEVSTTKVEKVLRKSKRFGTNDHKDNETTQKTLLYKNDDILKENSSSNTPIVVFPTAKATTGNSKPFDLELSAKLNDTSETKKNYATNNKPSDLEISAKLNDTSETKKIPAHNIKKCHVRLKNIAKKDFNKLGKLGIMEEFVESQASSSNPSADTVQNFEANKMNKERNDHPSIKEISSQESEEMLHNEKSLKKVANIPQEKHLLPSSNNNTNCSTSNKLVDININENLLKCLANFGGSDITDSLSNSAASNVNSIPPSYEFPSQTSSKDLFMNSPGGIRHSSDEEIEETPPYKDTADASVSRLKDKSITLHSPLLFTQNSSPSFIPQNKELKTAETKQQAVICISSSNDSDANAKNCSALSSDATVVLAPLDLPPTREEVLKGCIKLKLPEYEFQQPYYSNPDDITKQKEIGFTILQITGNKLNDLEEFQSILGDDLKGLCAWRRNQLLRLGGPEMLNKYRNSQRQREYFADQKVVAMTPQEKPPTRQEVKIWLKARELLKNKEGNNEADEEKLKRLTEVDSPIKVRRQKVTLMLNNEGDDSGDDGDNSLDCSSRSLTLTPLTPTTPLSNDAHKEKINKSFTPVTTKLQKIPLERLSFLRRRNNRRVLRRVPLNQKLKEALEGDKSSPSSSKSQQSDVILPKEEMVQKSSTSVSKYQESDVPPSVEGGKSSPIVFRKSQESDVVPCSEESIVPHSQTSETSSVSSQAALAEMNRSSFMQQIQQHDVTIGFSNNNSTLNNSYGFKVALENLQQAKSDIEFNYLTIITLEVFVPTRDDLFPDPKIDEIRCIFYAIENSIPNDHIDNDKKLPRKSCGYIMVHDTRDAAAKEGHIHGIDHDIQITIVNSEVEALEALLGLCSRWDSDIYAGYEIEMSSWGFVIDRAKYLCLNIAPLLSRVPTQKVRDFVDEDRDQFTDLDVEMKLCGRILLDVWRLMRSEIALTSYTFENVMYHIMHKRCPWHSYRTLTDWFRAPCSRWIVIEYYLERVRGTLGLLDQLDLIGRTSEMAKLIGIQFYEVLSRGSQFRVESMMLRIAKPKNLVPLSPSVQQRAHMRAPEYLPLILEPQSRFYADPLIVLDFQSLYPSMIIGYNYCYSTCLGRVEHLGQSAPFEFGASQLRVSPFMLRKLVDRDLITISPCGVVFVKSSVREGILPRLLTEILDTRQMVKQSMKVHKTNSALQRILHSRQLGLKLMANTTYGYTAANFSGRMPAVEVGDTVVAKGRETLERAIKMVEANEKWNVKVVYGDTDSLFVLVPGRNREEAFRIGAEIAEEVTKQNPQPVKLKLEKVYQPCILQTKKRYVGYMYETPDQKEPVYEAKGIETVRRDGCPMVAKMLEKVLRILFESADVSQVKQYVCRHFTKLLSGRANLQDLIFAKEFRGLNGYKPTACVPALEMTRKWLQSDPRRIPRRGERVPFIITNGPPGVPLIRLIRHPHEVLADEGLKINAVYYITKAIIPPLNRCLLLIGADVNEWFANLPRKILMTPALSIANEVIACPNSKFKKSTISQFFSTTNCITDCGRHTKQGICDECNRNPSRSMITLQMKISKIERAYLSTQQICQSCCGRGGDLKCGSLDCPVVYVLEVKRRDLQQIGHFRNLLEERF